VRRLKRDTSLLIGQTLATFGVLALPTSQDYFCYKADDDSTHDQQDWHNAGVVLLAAISFLGAVCNYLDSCSSLKAGGKGGGKITWSVFNMEGWVIICVEVMGIYWFLQFHNHLSTFDTRSLPMCAYVKLWDTDRMSPPDRLTISSNGSLITSEDVHLSFSHTPEVLRPLLSSDDISRGIIIPYMAHAFHCMFLEVRALLAILVGLFVRAASNFILVCSLFFPEKICKLRLVAFALILLPCILVVRMVDHNGHRASFFGGNYMADFEYCPSCCGGPVRFK